MYNKIYNNQNINPIISQNFVNNIYPNQLLNLNLKNNIQINQNQYNNTI